MGGYGATRIGMKFPEVFGALYIMSPCCLSPRGAPDAATMNEIAAAKTPADAVKLSWSARATLAAAAAWSPDPQRPPFYLDLPVKAGVADESVLQRWTANAPLSFIDQYIGNLKQYRAIALDVGDQDGLKTDTAELHRILDRYGIANRFELYSGDHISAVSDRFQNHVLPFFGKALQFAPPGK
jgi:S-formylglutathione hydrolase FrmB